MKNHRWGWIKGVFFLMLMALLLMIYWSLYLLEIDLKRIKGQGDVLQRELLDLKHKLENKSFEKPVEVIKDTLLPINKQDSGSYKNLLQSDPFYDHVLKTLLPSGFKPHGVRKEATIGKPDNLHPFSNWASVSGWQGLCTVFLAAQEVARYETLVPMMATKMELRYDTQGHPEYWVFLRKDLYWEPLKQTFFSDEIQLAPHFLERHPVTTHDFKFCFDAIMNPHVEESGAVASRTYFNDIESIRIIDDYTMVIKWSTKSFLDSEGKTIQKMKYMSGSLTGSLRPLASFVYKYFSDGSKIVQNDNDPETYRTNPIWAQNFSHHWAINIIPSCGPWLFNGMTDQGIRFTRNSNYFDPLAVLVEDYEIRFKDSSHSIWEDFKANNFDMYTVPANQLSELERFLKSPAYQDQVKERGAIKKLNYVDRAYSYIGWNQANPLFKSKKVRQALTMAIDRDRIIRQNLNGMGMQTTGVFFPFSPSYDKSIKPYPFNPNRALELLREEGWFDRSGDGVLEKDIEGKRIPFTFSLTYFVKNPVTKSIVEYVATALKHIGVQCVLNGVDVADLSGTIEEKSFDALCLSWILGSPPEDPKQLWYSKESKIRGSSNIISFANSEIDEIIEQLEYEDDKNKRMDLYHRFDQIIYDESPYTFLFTPKVTLAYREYLQNVFIPAERKDLIPDANVGEPNPAIFWILNRE